MCYLCIKILPIEEWAQSIAHTHTHIDLYVRCTNTTIQTPGFVILAEVKIHREKQHTRKKAHDREIFGWKFMENIEVRTRWKRKQPNTNEVYAFNTVGGV